MLEQSLSAFCGKAEVRRQKAEGFLIGTNKLVARILSLINLKLSSIRKRFTVPTIWILNLHIIDSFAFCPLPSALCLRLYPDWFSLKNLAIAHQLVELEFDFGGRSNLQYYKDDWFVEEIEGWKFYVDRDCDEGEIELIAIADEAFYCTYLDEKEGRTSTVLLERIKQIIDRTPDTFKQNNNFLLPVVEELDLNVLPAIDLSKYLPSEINLPNAIARSLAEEIETQKALLEFVEVSSPEYLEIQSNLIEAIEQLHQCNI